MDHTLCGWYHSQISTNTAQTSVLGIRLPRSDQGSHRETGWGSKVGHECWRSISSTTERHQADWPCRMLLRRKGWVQGCPQSTSAGKKSGSLGWHMRFFCHSRYTLLHNVNSWDDVIVIFQVKVDLLRLQKAFNATLLIAEMAAVMLQCHIFYHVERDICGKSHFRILAAYFLIERQE